MASYETAFLWLMVDEGSTFTDDPNDHGGATRWGITQASLAEWRRRPVTREDVAALELADAHAFYLQMYWEPLQLALCAAQASANTLLSLAVLTGRKRTTQTAQSVCGAAVDGILGASTLAAINALPPLGFVAGMMMRMELFFISRVEADPSQMRFLRGWVKRGHRLLDAVS